MATDNLNYYSAGLPAGQQTDRYSSQPGCLRSKNLDIFSSSKSVKATAWSEPTTTGSDIIKQDGNLILKTDSKVYDISSGTEVLLVNPSANFPVYPVNYNGSEGVYSNATWGTPQDLVTKYEGDELKSFTVFTDRNAYTWSSEKFVADKEFINVNRLTYDSLSSDGYSFHQDTASSPASITIRFNSAHFARNVPIRIHADQYDSSNTNISINYARKYRSKYYYDAELDGMLPLYTGDYTDITVGSITAEGGATFYVDISPEEGDDIYDLVLSFSFTKKSGAADYSWAGSLNIDINGGPNENHRMKLSDGTVSTGDYNAYYSYLPIRERKLTDIGEYYWMKGVTFQPLYSWVGSWITVNGGKKTRYDFVQYMGWNNDVAMDVIGMVSWNEQIYMVGNMNGNGYIFPCDLTGGRGTPYIAYGCEFKGVTNIDYLLYLVGEDRGVSQLWVYNGQELVSILGGTEEKDTVNLIDTTEQYRFDGKMVEYRGDLILSTLDNRIFAYGQTYGGKGGVFIHQLPGTITKLVAKDKDLIVDYSVTEDNVTTKYITSLQDDTPIKNYNTEWETVYPIVVGNHLLEKEESDLYCSYILPSADTSLEFWASANHYHFWTFKTDGNTTPTVGSKWIIDGTDGNYNLEFVENNGGYLTFKLVGDLPVMTGDETMRLTEYLTLQTPTYIPYTEYNHFRKIGEITTTEYQEGEIRFHNLNNKLELPKSHSLQVMVRGKGTANYTPELFALDLVANQRERG